MASCSYPATAPAGTLAAHLAGTYQCETIPFCRDQIELDGRGRAVYSTGCCLGMQVVAHGIAHVEGSELSFEWTKKPGHWKPGRDRAVIQRDGELELANGYRFHKLD